MAELVRRYKGLLSMQRLEAMVRKGAYGQPSVKITPDSALRLSGDSGGGYRWSRRRYEDRWTTYISAKDERCEHGLW